MQLSKKDLLGWLSFPLLDEAGVKNAVTLCPQDRPFDLVRAHLGIEKLSWAQQCHGDRIEIASDVVLPCDALISNEPGRGIAMMHADCQIALFYDPIQKKAAAAHAGWRGNIARLYTKTLQRMGGDPSNILVAISPSLGRAQFVHWEKEWPQEFWHHRKGDTMDLWGIAEEELLQAGILPHHVQIARICTLDDERFFSHRRNGCQERNLTVISLASA